MDEEIYRVADLIAHYAESQTRGLGESESFVATAEEFESEVRGMVQLLKKEHPDAAPSIWSDFDGAKEGDIADAFARDFRCFPTPEGRLVFLDNPPGLPYRAYYISKCSELAKDLMVRFYLSVSAPESDLDN